MLRHSHTLGTFHGAPFSVETSWSPCYRTGSGQGRVRLLASSGPTTRPPQPAPGSGRRISTSHLIYGAFRLSRTKGISLKTQTQPLQAVMHSVQSAFHCDPKCPPTWAMLRNVTLGPEVRGSLIGCESEIIACHGLEIETPSQVRG